MTIIRVNDESALVNARPILMNLIQYFNQGLILILSATGSAEA